MGLIKGFFENFTKEDERLTAIKVERENTTGEQNYHLTDLKCPICGNNEFNKSLLTSKFASGGSYDKGSVGKLISYYNNYNKVYETNSKMCLHCGYILSFADMNTMDIKNLP